MSKIVVIVGPTAVGKTKLSVLLAKKMNAEIINADSMQIYKDLDIGTAKATKEEMDGVVHHLLDFVDPNNFYSVYDYQRDARKVLDKLLAEGKNVIIVGGTGLYIKALLYDYKFNKEDKKYDFSRMSNEEILEEIHRLAPSVDIHVNNRKRLERALTKLNNGGHFDDGGKNKLYKFDIIGLTTDREILYQKINDRVDVMMYSGLLQEVKDLYERGVHGKAIQTGIGYKELYYYFDGNLPLRDAVNLIKQNSRKYAKRQYTFFRNQMDVKWFDTNYEDFDKTVQEVLDYLGE